MESEGALSGSSSSELSTTLSTTQIPLFGATRSTQIIEHPSEAKPFLKWAGGKSRLVRELAARVPPHFHTYFEPFIGGGALFFHLAPRRAYICDINPELINCYRVVKGHAKALIKQLAKHIHSKSYFYEIRGVDRAPEYRDWTPVQRASRLIYLNKTCYNGLYRVNSKGFFNTPFGDYENPRYYDEENLLACSKILRDAKIARAHFGSIEHQAKKGDFVYFDPPYVPLSATSSFTSYAKGGFDLKMQLELRDLCLRLGKRGVKVMISNSHTEWVREAYKNFSVDVIYAPRSINSKATKRHPIQEVVITNY